MWPQDHEWSPHHHDGVSSNEIRTYEVVLGDDLTQEVTGGTETVVFDDVPPGDHEVLIKRDGKVITRRSRSRSTPPQVFVRCEDEVGLVTIRVFNTEGESRTSTIPVDDLQLGVDEYAIVVDEARP